MEFSAGATLTDKAVSFSSIVVPVDATAGKDMQAVFTIDGKQLQFTFRPERNGNALTVISTTSYWGITVWSSAVPMAAV